MRTKTAVLAAAGTLGLTIVTGAAVASPMATDITAALTAAATETDGTADGTAEADRTASLVERIKEALSGLVSDGTITQEQSEQVASTLADSDALRGPGGHGHHGHGLGFGPGMFGEGLDAAAEVLGMTGEELRDALRDGATLGAIADEQGVDRQQLVDALVAAATERINEAVADGRLTQEQADERIAELPDKVTELLDRALPTRGERPGGPEDGSTERQTDPSEGATTDS